MKTILKYWLLMAVVITGLVGLCYAAIQQDLRQSANDPQIQMSEDIATKLADGLRFPTENVQSLAKLREYVKLPLSLSKCTICNQNALCFPFKMHHFGRKMPSFQGKMPWKKPLLSAIL